MKLIRVLVVLMLAVASAQAQIAQPAIRESTDPSKVAEVEAAVASLRAMQALDRVSGRGAPAASVVTGRTETGINFLCGGIAEGDRSAMSAQRARYSLWVATVAKPSGAYLSDARLRIVDLTSGRTQIDRTMDGPWFFADLPAGRYEVSAAVMADGASQPQTLSTQVRVSGRAQRQAVFRFVSNAQVGPESATLPKGNPFGTPAM